MALARHFLGWDAPLTEKVCSFLLDRQASGPIDLEKTLLLVPTRQAGRRLREALAVRCAERETALLSARVITPGALLHYNSPAEPEATPSLVKAVWADVLLRCPVSQLDGLFPSPPPVRDFAWALRVGDMLQSLRGTLADAGHRIEDVARLCGDSLPEPDRWRDLAQLETLYLKTMDALGAADPCVSSIRSADKIRLPEDIERLVIAAVPDPSPLALLAIERFASELEVDVLVHADPTLAEGFDEWGHPLPAYWSGKRLSVPQPEVNVVLAGSPLTQAQHVLHEIAFSAADFGPADIAIGVPDRTVAPFLVRVLEDQGLPVFDPADKPLHEHPLYGLVERLGALVRDPGYAQVGTLLRHPDILAYLEDAHQCPPATLLAELDKFQNACLPADLDAMVAGLSAKGETRPNLGRAVALLKHLREAALSGGPEPTLRELLRTVYSDREINTSSKDDRDFEQAAACLDAVLREQSDTWPDALVLAPEDALTLFLQRLAEQSYPPGPREALLDIEGWLELPWNDAPFLIVTGMNDGAVPGGRLSDVFLPDSLCQRLGLPDDATRFARDMYLMCGLIESRRALGRVCFIAGKTGTAGDPLKPSRLFFQCADEELPVLASKLFGSSLTDRAQYPAGISFKLDAAACRPAEEMPPQRLSVTALRDYLVCPFRFYLKHALQMEECADDKVGLDALDFGIMVHDVLEAMAKDQAMRTCDDPSTLADFFSAEADAWVEHRFGREPTLPVWVSLDAARQRLRAVAHVQADLVRSGWEIVDSELKLETELRGISIRGKIDRIDRHCESGHLRVIDYKTSDSEVAPGSAHLAAVRADTPDFATVTVNGKARRWIDLQLPLYLRLLSEKQPEPGSMELAYFNLPKAVTHTGVRVWEGFNDELLKAATACASAIIDRIKQRVFWPPTERVQRDDFETLFYGAAADCFEKL